jgi:hypothetical protein
VNPKGNTCVINKKNQLKLKLKFKLLRTDEDITPKTVLALFNELLKRIRLRELIKRYMPPSGSDRGYESKENKFGS